MKPKRIAELRALGLKIAILLYNSMESNSNGLRLKKIAKLVDKKKETIEAAIYCKINRNLFEKSKKEKGRWLYRLTAIGKNAVKEHKENVAAQNTTPELTSATDKPKSIIQTEGGEPVEPTPSKDTSASAENTAQ